MCLIRLEVFEFSITKGKADLKQILPEFALTLMPRREASVVDILRRFVRTNNQL